MSVSETCDSNKAVTMGQLKIQSDGKLASKEAFVHALDLSYQVSINCCRDIF
jgi:hypothetical protein